MRALILCGGRGTRAWPSTAEIPKPMLTVGDRPVLRHVMDIFSGQGVTDFVLATGYRHDIVEAYTHELPSTWSVTAVDTGDDADTGDRVLSCLDYMTDEFFVTYGDGVGDIDIDALVARHRSHPGGATVTVVPLPSQYGTLDVDSEDRVQDFREKPVLTDHLINAGFFVFDRRVLDGAPDGSLERDIMPELCQRRELFVYRHSGFWRSMDTQKDIAELDQLARREGTPWLPTPGSPAHASSSPAPPGSSDRT